MFAADPRLVAAELAATCAPGGLISATAWTDAGAFGGLPRVIAELLPSSGVDVTAWADEDRVAEFFSGTEREVVRQHTGRVPIPFESPEAAVVAVRRDSGP